LHPARATALRPRLSRSANFGLPSRLPLELECCCSEILARSSVLASSAACSAELGSTPSGKSAALAKTATGVASSPVAALLLASVAIKLAIRVNLGGMVLKVSTIDISSLCSIVLLVATRSRKLRGSFRAGSCFWDFAYESKFNRWCYRRCKQIMSRRLVIDRTKPIENHCLSTGVAVIVSLPMKRYRFI
jgi:hypothetical protein